MTAFLGFGIDCPIAFAEILVDAADDVLESMGKLVNEDVLVSWFTVNWNLTGL